MAIVVGPLDSDAASGRFDCAAPVTLDGRSRRLSFTRYGDHPDLLRRADVHDAFAVALLVPAMIRGEPLVIEGTVDEVLLLSLRGPVQDVIRLMAPAWPRVRIEAEVRPAETVTDWSKGAATAMSGGVDSMHLVRHRLLDPATPVPLRVRLLMHHHVGAHGEDDAVFEEQFAHARRIADRLGLPLVGTRCALREAYRSMRFIHCVTMRNVAAALVLDHLFTAFHFASTERFGDRPVMTRDSGISVLDATLLPMFSTTRTVWLPFGGGTSRLRKTAEVLGDDRLRRDLLVCVRGFRRDRAKLNCGRCYKCARVLLHAEADGHLDEMSTTFDIDGYCRGRDYAVLRLLRVSLGPWRNGNDIDLLKYLDERRFSFPAWSKPAVAVAMLAHGRRHTIADPA